MPDASDLEFDNCHLRSGLQEGTALNFEGFVECLLRVLQCLGSYAGKKPKEAGGTFSEPPIP